MALCRPATDGFGVPVISFLVYFIWFPFPSVKPLLSAPVWFSLLSAGHDGLHVTGAVRVILRVIRGKKLTGRPWWYRRSQR
nr:Uncharacterised protein [Klebsiella pneumoniae]